MRDFFSAISFLVFVYSVSMGPTTTVWYVLTNALTALAWFSLALLIHMFRNRLATPIVSGWVLPLTWAFKGFCILSGVRSIINGLLVVFPSQLIGVQSFAFFVNNIALAFAVGYASVYYKRLPRFLLRLVKHQANSRRFETMTSMMVDGLIETDSTGYIAFTNAAAASIFRVAGSAKLLAVNVYELLSPETQPVLDLTNYVETGVSRVIGNTKPFYGHGVRTDGSMFPIELTVSHYVINDKHRFVFIIRDITGRENLEKAVDALTYLS